MSQKDIDKGNKGDENSSNNGNKRPLLGRRDWLKMGGAAIGASILGIGHEVTPTAASTQRSADSDEYLNLASEVPQRALDLWDRQPDDYRDAFPIQDVTDYAGRTGDLAEAIKDASGNGRIADLGSNNEYELGSMATALGSHFGVIGDNCTIYYNRNDLKWMMQPNCDVGVIKGVTFDISEHSDSSAAILGGNFEQEFWAEDVELVGERNLPEESRTTFYNWRPHMTNEDAEGFVENLRLPDGNYYSGSGDPPKGTRAIGVSADPGHVGYIVYKDCHAEGWTGNGFYMSINPHDSPGGWGAGGSLLWNCTAINNHKGNLRIGLNDKIVGGYVDVSDMPGELKGQGVVCDYATGDENNPTEIIGVRSGGNDYSAEAIVCRNFYYTGGETAHVRFKKIVLEASGPMTPLSVRPGRKLPENEPTAEIPEGVVAEFEDVYLYDDYAGSATSRGMVEIRDDADVFAKAFRARSEQNAEVEVQSGGSFTHNETPYGSGQHTADKLGLDDPRDEHDGLPEFYFDYDGDRGEKGGTVDRPADTRVTSGITGPSGVRIQTQEELSGLELTISEQTTGADTAEIANSLGETLVQKDISGLGPGATFRIEHDLTADQEYILLVYADDTYDRGAYDETPDWPYDGGSFQVLEGIWGRDNSSTANFYAYTTITALL